MVTWGIAFVRWDSDAREIGVQADTGAIVAQQNEVPDMIGQAVSGRTVALVVVFICLRKIAPN